MAEPIDNLRKQYRMLAAQAAGLSSTQPRFATSQQMAVRMQSEILSLPVDDSNWTPLQDLTADGAVFFMLGFDGIGGAPLG